MRSEYQRWKRVVGALRCDYDRAKLMPIDTVRNREYRSAAMQSAGARMIQLEMLSGVSIFGPHGQSRDMNDRLAALDDYADSLAVRSLGHSSVMSDNLRYIDLTGNDAVKGAEHADVTVRAANGGT